MMIKNVLVLQHIPCEGLGSLEMFFQAKKVHVDYRQLSNGDSVPRGLKGYDALVSLGGPMNVYEVEKYPFLGDEGRLLREAICTDFPTLGVCLGAQLIGEALGAKFDHSPNREIGVFELKLTEDAKDDPVFSKFPEKFLVGHWHGDMPGLTPESKILATSKGCPRQVVRYTPKVYGFQCHFEFTPEAIEGMINNCSNELEEYNKLPYIQSAEELRNQDYKSFNKLLFSFLDYMEKLTDKVVRELQIKP